MRQQGCVYFLVAEENLFRGKDEFMYIVLYKFCKLLWHLYLAFI